LPIPSLVSTSELRQLLGHIFEKLLV